MIKRKVEDKVLDLLALASELGEFDIPEIKFNLKGACAGMCCLEGNRCVLRFNLKLLRENQEEFLEIIVPHEVAHYVVAVLFDRVRPHGTQWKTVMRFFGIEHPQRCHGFDLSDLYPWIYKCQCQEHFVSQRQHAVIIEGKRDYRCRDCKGSIKFVGKRVDK